MSRLLEVKQFARELDVLGQRPVEVSLESMQGVVNIIDPVDFTDKADSLIDSGGEVRRMVEDVMGGLTERERRVLDLRFGLSDGHSMTQVAVGKLPEFSCSRWTVGRIERIALGKLRAPTL